MQKLIFNEFTIGIPGIDMGIADVPECGGIGIVGVLIRPGGAIPGAI